MLNISGRARLMLDLLFGAGILFGAAVALKVGVLLSPGRGVLMAVALVAAIICWVAWRRGGHRDAPLIELLVGCALVVGLAGDGSGVLPLFFVALIILMVERGPVAGLVAVGVLVAGSATVMALAYQRAVDEILAQSLGALVVLGLGLLVALLIREADQARQENGRLLAEVRASFDSEKDHVLAQERARAASDLHDGLGHQLTALRMSLDFAERTRTRDPDAAWHEVGRARDLATMAVDRMRTWVRALDPVSVGALTGTAALERVAEAFRGTGLEVSVTTKGPELELDREQALFCLRVVQEGLTNALRHGGAQRAELVVEHGDGLTLTLTDDGTEPDEGGAPDAGYGLRSLAERATRLGGTLDAGWCDRGFRLSAHLPAPRTGVVAR